MNINKFLDRSKVKFKQPVGSNELDSILSHVSQKINCEVRRSLINHKSFSPSNSTQGSEDLDDIVCGRIGDHDNHIKFTVNPYCGREPHYAGKQFGEIEFSCPLRYGLHNLPKSYLDLVKSVRKAVNNYFSK